jgi:FAD/FMN-containing dehydrogenase/Fe-S oxidoreductase
MIEFRELRRRALERQLKRSIQGEVRFDLPTRRLYSTDASIYQIEPLGVVIPRTAEDVRVIVQIAAEHATPLVPRGGGTSLSGQSIGPGIVVDCSKHLNRILDLDPVERRVHVQPGVILDQLNRAALPHDLWFGADVATASRANLGGMIGNNSAGARSIVYGKTGDHVERLRVVLSDGSLAQLEPLGPRDWNRRGHGQGLEAQLYRTLPQLLHDQEAEIHARFPKIIRRVSGYAMDVLLEQLHGPQASLASLMVGSEGTLGFVTEAELRLVPRPRHRALLVPHFASLADAMAALEACLELQPSAVELLDQMILELARGNLALRDQMAMIQGRPASLFMVEFSSDDPGDVLDRIEKLEKRLRGAAGVTAMVRAMEPSLREPLWNLRSAAVPLLLGVPGDRKPVTFVEDAAVAPERLPPFVEEFRAILQRHGTDGAFYGHASVGCLHIRPVLDLKQASDVATMRLITDEVTSLVLNHAGSLSGEHGDGLARSEWNRKMFGPQLYESFRCIKRLFDPANLFNPGKVVDAPAMTENLRLGPAYHPDVPAVHFDYAKQGGMAGSVEMCNGSGVCRKLHGGVMCPSFRATRDEKDSTRGRANALRLAMTSKEPLDPLQRDWVFDVLDLCLMCKACKAECPSNVDVAKLKAEFLHSYYEVNARPLGQRLLADVPRLMRLGSWLAPLSNLAGGNRLARWLMELAVGIDRRRSLPRLRFQHFRRWFRRHKPDWLAGRNGQVLLLDDCFTTYTEPEVGIAAVQVLERAGLRVELAGLVCCGRPLISKGFLVEARRLIRDQAARLAPRLARGTPLLGLEPSCLLTLTDEWPELAAEPAVKEVAQIARASRLADEWLAEQLADNRAELRLNPLGRDCLLHGHCHQKALVGMNGTVTLLRRVPDLRVELLDTGCCGMAGAFGYEREHYDLSTAIAGLSLLPELERKPEALVIAPGTSCRHQIKDLAGRRALHPLEVLAGQL